MKKFEDLKGKTLTSIIGKVGDDVMTFNTSDGGVAQLYYDYD